MQSSKNEDVSTQGVSNEQCDNQTVEPEINLKTDTAENYKFNLNFAFHRENAIVQKQSVSSYKKLTPRQQPSMFKNQNDERKEVGDKFSKFILPCFIFLTGRESTHAIRDIIGSADDDPVPKLQELLPSLSSVIRSIFKKSNFKGNPFFHDQQYFNFARSVASLSDDAVLKLTAMIHCGIRSNLSKQKIIILCSKSISKNKGSLMHFNKFLDCLLSTKKQSAKKKVKNIESIPQTPKRRELVMSMFSDVAPELEPRMNAPRQKKLPVFSPRPVADELVHKTKSYILLQTPLQKYVQDALLFNTQYVSLPSGSEGGSTEQSVDEQFINDKEDYFAATAYIPDAQVRIFRIEKALAHLEQGPVSEFCEYPGYLVASIKDIYGTYAPLVFEAMEKDYAKVCSCLIPTFQMVKDRYYEVERDWNQFHTYENCVFGRQMILRVPDPDLSLPMKITRTKEWDYIHEMFNVLSNNQNGTANGAIDDFFRIMKALHGPSYFPRIVVSALQLIPSILQAFRDFDDFIDREIDEDLRFIVKVQLSITELGLKASLTREDSIEDDFLVSDAPRAMKLLVQHYTDMHLNRPGRTCWDAVFGGKEGHALTKKVNAFLAIMDACDVRDEFWPLVDLFDDVQKRKVKIAHYPIMARKLCPVRELFVIDQTGGTINCGKALDQIPQVVLPILFTPPQDLTK